MINACAIIVHVEPVWKLRGVERKMRLNTISIKLREVTTESIPHSDNSSPETMRFLMRFAFIQSVYMILTDIRSFDLEGFDRVTHIRNLLSIT